MTYKEELATYIDQATNLVGKTPNKANYSSGNALLETGTAYVIAKITKAPGFDQAYKPMLDAMVSCKEPMGSFFTKNPGVPDDKISHDDVIGMVAGAVACGSVAKLYVEELIIKRGLSNVWVLNTTGFKYWDAYTKPWHKGYYIIATDVAKIKLFDAICYAGMLIADALHNKDNSSDKRLCHIMVETTPKGRSIIVDKAISIWRSLTLKKWGSYAKIYDVFHGTDHVFTKQMRQAGL